MRVCVKVSVSVCSTIVVEFFAEANTLRRNCIDGDTEYLRLKGQGNEKEID